MKKDEREALQTVIRLAEVHVRALQYKDLARDYAKCVNKVQAWLDAIDACEDCDGNGVIRGIVLRDELFTCDICGGTGEKQGD
jgi:hypothetical protein